MVRGGGGEAAKVKIYIEQLQLQKLTLDDIECMINHSGQGALDSRSRKTLSWGWGGISQGLFFNCSLGKNKRSKRAGSGENSELCVLVL